MPKGERRAARRRVSPPGLVSGLPEEAGGSSVLWYRALFAPRGAHVPGLWASPPAPCVQLLPGRAGGLRV